MKTQDYAQEKVLILISSVVTWVNTPPNRKPVKKVEESTDTESEIDRPDQLENTGLDEAGERIYPFEESDISKRVPSPKFQSLKTLENKALAAMKSKDNLKVYVLCSGVLYGHGEDAFYTHVKKAWLQKVPNLDVIGSGENIIPTLHVKDLANLVKRISVIKPVHYYSFAIDKSTDQTQSSIVEAISKGIGTGEIQSIELDDVIYEDWAEFLNLNVRMTPSTIFEELYINEPDEDEPKDFPWHCEKGIRENTDKINTEFNKYRGLSPMKIYINGPPASGKSHYAEQLSKIYGIPHIKISDIANFADTIQGDTGDQIRSFIESKKDETMEEFEKSKKKGQELTRDEIVVKLEDKHIYMLAKLKLQENACRNKGFILDGFPKSNKDCYHTFYEKLIKYDENGNEIVEEPVKQPDGEGEQDDQPPAEGEDAQEPAIDWENDYELNKSLLPKIFIQMTGDIEFIKNRVKELPEEKTSGTHWNDADIDRRYGVYNEYNTRAEEGEDDKKLLVDFFRDHDITIFDQNCEEEEQKVIEYFQQLITENFIPPAIDQEGQVESDHDILTRHLENRVEEKEEIIDEEQQELKEEEAKAEEIKAKTRLDKIKEQERELLDTRSQPIRQYLMDNVVPLLTEGLIEICKTMPDKPTGELADYLLKRCEEIENEVQEGMDTL